MKKSFSKLLALALTASLVLSGCGGTSGSSDKEEDTSGKTEASGNEEAQAEEKEESAEAITDLVISKVASSELATFNLLNSETSADTQYLTNLWDGLLEASSYGELVPALAEEWGT